MNRKVKFGIWFFVVFLVGFIAGVVLISLQFHRAALAPFNNMTLCEIAIDARQLSQGKAEDVLKRKVSALPPLTKTYYNYYYKFMLADDSRYASLWQVQKYYEVSGDAIPAEIKPILDSLPKKPLTSCELKRIKDGNSPAVCEPK